VVLDPFLGTGTTTEAAIRAERCSIGYEIEPRYIDIIRDRFAQQTLAAEAEIHLPQR
jgi:DNA modification methylase